MTAPLFSRRAALGLAATAVAATAVACGGDTSEEPSASGDTTSGAGLTPVKLQLQWVAQAQFAGYYAAKDQGYYEAEGLDVAEYRERFGTDPADDFPATLQRFADRGWLDPGAPPRRLRLSPEGLAYSDALGPELFSPAVGAAMAAYDAR